MDAGRKRAERLRTQGDFQWHGYPDPVSVETCSCARTYSHCGKRIRVRSRFEPAMRCIAPIWRVTLCADVACLAWSGWMRDLHGIRSGRNDHRDRPLKPVLQKRLKKRTDCGGKHLGCSRKADQGLQCGLSGNRVAHPATVCLGTERGTASIGNEGCSVGKTDPHLSRKIYLFCCRCLSLSKSSLGALF